MISWRMTARNVAELSAGFGGLGINVPPRTERKDQFAEELRCLRRYLFPLADKGLLEFPIEVVKHEPPDFICRSRTGESIGLEVTKATRKEFEADLTRWHRQQATRHYVSDQATGTMFLDVLGWAGDAVETEWVGYIRSSIADKLSDIASYSVAECDLLIYDNTPLPAPNLKTVAEGVRLQFVKEPLADKEGRSFRVISVIRDPWLIYDIARKPQVLRYDVAWDGPAGLH
jgi:hypothetical protein